MLRLLAAVLPFRLVLLPPCLPSIAKVFARPWKLQAMKEVVKGGARLPQTVQVMMLPSFRLLALSSLGLL